MQKIIDVINVKECINKLNIYMKNYKVISNRNFNKKINKQNKEKYINKQICRNVYVYIYIYAYIYAYFRYSWRVLPTIPFFNCPPYFQSALTSICLGELCL